MRVGLAGILFFIISFSQLYAAPQLHVVWRDENSNGQCTDDAGRTAVGGPYAAEKGQWTPYFRINTDNRAGGCKLQLGITDPDGQMAGQEFVLQISTGLWGPIGNRPGCDTGRIVIPVTRGIVPQFTPEITIDTDRSSHSCLFEFSVLGAGSNSFELEIFSDTVRGGFNYCAGGGRAQANPPTTANAHFRTQEDDGGCQWRFRLN